jgi:hypothetical protein
MDREFNPLFHRATCLFMEGNSLNGLQEDTIKEVFMKLCIIKKLRKRKTSRLNWVNGLGEFLLFFFVILKEN